MSVAFLIRINFELIKTVSNALLDGLTFINQLKNEVMNKIKRFEELKCWKESRVLVKLVYELTHKDPFRLDYGLRNQIQRAAVSAMTNISEGFSRYSVKESVRFLGFTQSSCEEVKSLLYVAFDLNYITERELQDTYKKASDVRNLTLGLIRYLKKNDK